MPARTIVAPPKAIDFDAIRGELGIPDGYPAAAVDQARAAAAGDPAVDNGAARSAQGPLDIPFVTLDPPGSRDLDQAVHLSRREVEGGYLVRYAIADVAGFVPPAGPLAQETWRRGATLYRPDRSTPLDPVVLSEGAASGSAAMSVATNRSHRGASSSVSRPRAQPGSNADRNRARGRTAIVRARLRCSYHERPSPQGSSES
jgi:hypothetical protein